MTLLQKLKVIEEQLSAIIDETVPILWETNYKEFNFALKISGDQYLVAHDWCGEHVRYNDLAVKRYGVDSVIFFFKKAEDATLFRITFNATPLKRQ